MWSSSENRLNLANGASNPCGDISIATDQERREEPGTEFLATDPATVYGQRVTDEVTEPIGIYIYSRPDNDCTRCQENFTDHKSWKEHLRKHHSYIVPTYQCSKCSRTYPSIFGISSHFSKCALPTTSPSGDLEFKCPNCEASFGSKRGLGIHQRRKHPAEHEADQQTQRTKKRWTQEELLFMAECEASIPLHKTNCNQLLHWYFPHCTIESIKGVRKGERYRQLLQAAKEKETQKPSSDEPTTNEVFLPTAQPETNTTPLNNLTNANSTTNQTSNLTCPTSNEPSYHEDPFLLHLQDLSTQVNTELTSIIAGHLNSIDITEDLERYITDNLTGMPVVCRCRTNQPPTAINVSTAVPSSIDNMPNFSDSFPPISNDSQTKFSTNYLHPPPSCLLPASKPHIKNYTNHPPHTTPASTKDQVL